MQDGSDDNMIPSRLWPLLIVGRSMINFIDSSVLVKAGNPLEFSTFDAYSCDVTAPHYLLKPLLTISKVRNH